MIFTIIIYSRDHGSNSYVEFQLGLQNSINMRVLIIFATCTATRIRDHGSNSYVEFQLGLQNSINTRISELNLHTPSSGY